MNIGVCKVTLRLPENHSLKGKRRVISSLCSRVRSKFNVSVAEVGDNEAWQIAKLGMACASNDSRHIDEVLSKAVAFIERSGGDLELVDDERETISGF